MENIIKPLRSLDWNDIDSVERGTRTIFDQLTSDRSTIRGVLLNLPDRADLLELCEHYDILDKIVLHDDPSGIRVRLHVFLPGYFDRPHNHRWSYASTILKGEYRHYLFGNAELDEKVNPASLMAYQVRQEPLGATYALHHAMVHAVVAEPYTVSLVVRGPAAKERFVVMDRKTGESWWQYGAQQEDTETIKAKKMSLKRLNELTRHMRDWNLF